LRTTLTVRSQEGIPSLEELAALEEEMPDALKIGAPMGTYANFVLLSKRRIDRGGQPSEETLWAAERRGRRVFIERISAVAGLKAFHLRFEIPAAGFEPFEKTVQALAEDIRWQPRSYRPSTRASAYRALGERFLGQRKYADALRALQNALALSPGEGAVRLLLGDAAREAGEIDLAESAYREAIRLRPSDPRPYRGLSEIMRQRKNLPEAITLLREAAALSPLDASIYADLGRVLLEAKLPQEARESFQKAIRRDRTMAEAYAGLARSYRKIGKYDLAANAFREALRIRPSLGQIHCELLEIYITQGFSSEAENERKLCPNPPKSAIERSD
jgi:tetratricopeptide (TPR) repeat protein